MTVDTRHLLDGAGLEVPNMEVAASSGEEDAWVGRRWVEGGCREGRTLDVQGEEERVRCRWVRVDVVKLERAAGSGGEEQR